LATIIERYSIIDFRFQKTLIITHKKQTAQPGDVSEDTTFKPGFETFSIFQTSKLQHISSSIFCEMDTLNGFLT
jgi:hypothetical protein